MNPNTATGFLQLISSAITPVVMISACSTMILGINSKHGSLAAQVRQMVADCRQAELAAARRQQLLLQLKLFYRRFVMTWIALSMLYGAVCVFILMTLLILFTQKRQWDFSAGSITLFVLGVALMLMAATLELFEIALSNRSLRVELGDILKTPSAAESPSSRSKP